MEQVQAQVLSHYRSEIVENIRASGGVLVSGGMTVKLAKEFGFCYGVERAIDLAYAAKKYFEETAPNTPIYLLGEIIHNPEVNDQISNLGIQIISPKPTEDELAQLNPGDAVIVPAFGTEVGTRKKIEAKGCIVVDTTCGDVMATAHGEDFAAAQAELLAATVEMRFEQRRQIEQWARAFNLPTRSEIDAIHKRLHDIGRALRAVQKR